MIQCYWTCQGPSCGSGAPRDNQCPAADCVCTTCTYGSKWNSFGACIIYSTNSPWFSCTFNMMCIAPTRLPVQLIDHCYNIYFHTDAQLVRLCIGMPNLHNGVPCCVTGCLDAHATPNRWQPVTQWGSPIVQQGKLKAVLSHNQARLRLSYCPTRQYEAVLLRNRR